MTAARPKPPARSPAFHSEARARRLARTFAPLLIASTSFGCAGQLADELGDEAEESNLGVQLQEQVTTGTVGPGTVIGTPVIPTFPTNFPDGSIGTLQLDGGVAPPPPPVTPKPPVMPTTPPTSIDIEQKGQLICSRTPLKSCGTEKADWVGAYTLDTTCDEGFYDMLYGGTCWKCPTDDGRGSPWIRTLDAVNKDTACHREGQSHAIRVRGSGSLAWDCKDGSFWDGWDGGGCWVCPADRPRRTFDHIAASTACATWGLETSPARMLKFNGCPTPNAQTMGLKGKRKPGSPFLDIAGGWNQGVASGGCYACPVSDADGNILITDRNASPIYGDNQGCDVLLKFKPAPFYDSGLSGLPGIADFIIESGLLGAERLTAELYLLAESRGLKLGSTEAASWVAGQLQEIATTPYASQSMRTLVIAQIILASTKPEAQRTSAERSVIGAFERYLNRRRVHIARTGLEMYDAWKAADDSAKERMARSTLMVAFDFGTVPLNFHETLSNGMTIGAMGIGIAGSLAAAMKFASSAEVVKVGEKLYLSRATSLYGLGGKNYFQPINLLKGTAAANAALAGTVAITVAFAIIQSVAIDQFVQIQTARPKLEAALAVAQTQVTVQSLLGQEGGADQLLYWWAKAMESGETEDARVVTVAATAAAAAAKHKAPTNEQIAADQRLGLLDASWYLNKYPDLKTAFGSDLEKVKNHFLVSGIKEGRDASAGFSIGAYLARYADLQRAFGSDYEAALNHWFSYGKKEGRNPNPAGTYMADTRAASLDPIFYANKYPDLKQAFGYKVPLLVQHYLSYGIAEGRLPNANATK